MGYFFHGEFSSSDASAPSNEAAARMTLYGNSGSAITLVSDDIVTITDVLIVAGAAMTVTLYDGSDVTVSAGDRIVQGNFAANGGMTKGWMTPRQCRVGTCPKVKTSASGQVDVQISGYIEGSTRWGANS